MSSAASFHIWTIGCQMNAGDSRRLAEELAARGYQAADRPDDADVVVLNTCVVRQSAEDKVHGYLSSLKRLKQSHPHMLLAVMGCLVGSDGVDGELPARYPHVDLWLPPSRYEALLQKLPSLGAETSADLPPQVCRYITIMSGCNNFCSYCIVPYRRGRERSRPIDEIVAECEAAAGQGVREVTLLGQNVDSYGQDLPGRPTLAQVLRAVHEISALWRIRFLTNHPKDMSQELIETVAALPKICEHIELPLQSGNNDVLQRMNRHYTRGHYLELVRRIRAAIPAVALATDVIVGFPGETEEQFLDTYRLLEEVEFDTVHVACYSPRAGTTAARLPDDVPSQEKERRRQLVEMLQERVVGEHNAALLGQTVEVLFEEQVRGKWRGRTRTNKLAFVQSNDNLAGRLVSVRIVWAGPWSMQGDVATEPQR
ncbi:MAG: tRNA (N6-isopentenyl adenosine(37)-C2)-methylthiotransferase MiaB [Anaerolineae bacterium]